MAGVSSSTLPRPSQVTLTGWMIIVGSVLVVFSVVEQLSGMRSLETRQAVEAFLEEPPGQALGLDVEGMLALWRTAALVAAGCATAAVVLGWHVLRRHRGARVGLTVLAVPLFVTGVATGGFLSALVAAASLMLWMQPARDWFDGRRPSEPQRPVSTAERTAPAAQDPWATPPGAPGPGAAGPPPGDPGPQGPSGPGTQPPPFQGFGDPARSPHAGMPGLPPAPEKRPDSVLVAAVITWVLAGLALMISLASLVLVLSQPEMVMEELQRQDPDLMEQAEVTQDMLVATSALLGATVVGWSVFAIVLAVLTLRGRASAAVALLVSAVFTAVFCFVGSLAALPLIVPALGAVVVVSILRRPEVRAWLLARSRRRGPTG